MRRRQAGGRRLAAHFEKALAKRRWNEDDARTVIDALARSGESVAAFGKRHGLDPWRLARWRNQLREQEPPDVSDEMDSVFPVVVREDEAEPTGRAPIEVELPDGVIVRFAADFSQNSIRRLFEVLRC